MSKTRDYLVLLALSAFVVLITSQAFAAIQCVCDEMPSQMETMEDAENCHDMQSEMENASNDLSDDFSSLKMCCDYTCFGTTVFFDMNASDQSAPFLYQTVSYLKKADMWSSFSFHPDNPPPIA